MKLNLGLDFDPRIITSDHLVFRLDKNMRDKLKQYEDFKLYDEAMIFCLNRLLPESELKIIDSNIVLSNSK